MPTRVTDHSCTLIDHIYYYEGRSPNKPMHVTCGNIFSDLSDHLPNFICLIKSVSKINDKDRPLIRLFTTKNKDNFSAELSSINWNDVFGESKDVNVCYNKFLSMIQLNYDKCFPLTRISRRANRDKQWVTPALKNSIKSKNALYKKWVMSGEKTDEIIYKRYKQLFV